MMPHSSPPYPAEKARGAAIIFRHPWQRALFMAGLVGAVLLLAADLLF
jgi:hypothetical protein